MSNVKLIKLTSGEEILATIVDEVTASNNGVVVKDALAVILQPQQGVSPTAKIGFAFLPWGSLVSDKDDIVIKHSAIAYGPVTPIDEILKHYESVFSKIALPPTPGLVIAK